MLSIRCFPIIKFKKEFTLNDDIIPEAINWTSDNPTTLSSSLWNQCLINRKQAIAISSQLDNNSEYLDIPMYYNPELLIYRDIKVSMKELVENSRNPQTVRHDIRRFVETIRLDLSRRDLDFFKQKSFNINPYAIVVLKNNNYQGHIYSWIPNKKIWWFLNHPNIDHPGDYQVDNVYQIYDVLKGNEKIVIAIGIRARTDQIIMKKINPSIIVDNMANYLLEGVRRFAYFKGANFILISNPIASMVDILDTLGFKQVEYDPVFNQHNPLDLMSTKGRIKRIDNFVFVKDIAFYILNYTGYIFRHDKGYLSVVYFLDSKKVSSQIKFYNGKIIKITDYNLGQKIRKTYPLSNIVITGDDLFTPSSMIEKAYVNIERL